MLPTSFTLPVDVENNGTAVDRVYTQSQSVGDNKKIFVSAQHELDMRDEIHFSRRFPTRSGNSKGVKKTAIKIVRDVTVAGVDGTTHVAPIIKEYTSSIPLGVVEADELELRQIIVAVADMDSLVSDFQHTCSI